MKTPNPLIFLVCLWPLVLLVVWGFWNLRRSSREERLAARSQNWPEVYGKITSSEVVWGHFEVKYEYVVKGQTLAGKHEINLPPVLPSRTVSNPTLEQFNDETTQSIQDYPVGERVAVQYNPEHPEESYLLYVDKPSAEKVSSPQFETLDSI